MNVKSLTVVKVFIWTGCDFYPAMMPVFYHRNQLGVCSVVALLSPNFMISGTSIARNIEGDDLNNRSCLFPKLATFGVRKLCLLCQKSSSP